MIRICTHSPRVAPAFRAFAAPAGGNAVLASTSADLQGRALRRALGRLGRCRSSGPHYRTLGNTDTNGSTCIGVSKCLSTDVRVRVQFRRQWSAAFGIHSLDHDKYWNERPYRNGYSGELKFDL